MLVLSRCRILWIFAIVGAACWVPAAATAQKRPERCNGIDDDGNGAIDEGGAKLCDDGLSCTLDLCCNANFCPTPTGEYQRGSRCVNTPRHAQCDDGASCTQDVCTRRSLVSAAPPVGATGCSSTIVASVCPSAFCNPDDPEAEAGTGCLRSLWGLADLHSHLMVNLALGADEHGEWGPFHGKPGMNLSVSASGTSLARDLPPCESKAHHRYYATDEDLVRKVTREQIIEAFHSDGHLHGSSGYPNFSDWPHAHSRIHQQMHVTGLHRAYQGGLRLLVTGATDNQLITNMWRSIGFDFDGYSLSGPAHDADFLSARRQLDAIRDFAAANADWMVVVTTADEARQAILGNRLAVILSAEMDSLTLEQIKDLYENHQLRLITPIHLADNPSFGGAAAYDPLFNTLNKYLNGQFFAIERADHLTQRLPWPTEIVPQPSFDLGWAIVDFFTGNWVLRSLGAGVEGGDITPGLILALGSRGAHQAVRAGPEAAALGYEDGWRPYGNRNSQGLAAGATDRLRELMKLGMIIDLAHMSELAAEETIALAEQHRYPLIDSHTGVRLDDTLAQNERALRLDHARRVFELGGVIGIGTAGGNTPETSGTVYRAQGLQNLRSGERPYWLEDNGGRRTLNEQWDPLFRFTPSAPTYAVGLSGKVPTKHFASSPPSLELALWWGWGPPASGELEVMLLFSDWASHTVRVPVPRANSFRTNISIPSSRVLGELAAVIITGHGVPDQLAVDELWFKYGENRLQGELGAWSGGLRHLIRALPKAAFALGTDMNGLELQMEHAGEPGRVTQVRSYEFGEAPPNAPVLAPYSLGTKTFDVGRDGLAHYGMIPDFIQATKSQAIGESVVSTLYQSAQRMVESWAEMETAASTLE